jgi:hypothetical protein
MADGDEAPGDDLLYRVHIGGGDIPEPERLEPQTPVPVLLGLAGNTREPAVVRYFHHEREEDGHERILEAPVKEIGPQGIDGAALGAAKASHPEGVGKAFKIPPDIAMAPDAPRLTGKATARSGPRVLLAQLQ